MAFLTPDDYTIAWICALPLEAAAARAMLDEAHTPPQLSTDSNAYEFGELSGHYIVIAYLPAGVYGKVSAAAVLSRMRSTFRRLQFGLMVGIGGGVPGKNNDIRLGDVVVSKPGRNHSGVVQYDYGKVVQGGQFELMGTSNKPPPTLLTRLSQLEAKQITGSGEDTLLKTVSEVLEQNPNMKGRFSLPDQHTDFLFCSTYHHVDKEDNCEKCDKEQLVKRPMRDTRAPFVHYGLIASGDQVMKDSGTRDCLAQQYGILCFEMEAAGLMDELPTLVIRGICDYCDSHKQKQWQGYAALTAAAYTKLLLSIMPVCHTDSGLLKGKHVQHFMVPLARNPKFVSRQTEITKLEELLAMQDGPRRVAITGLGGIGKTQVALEVAYRIHDRDKECSVFWIPCTSHAIIEQTFLKVAQTLGQYLIKTTEIKEQIKLYLSSEHAGKWLLVFDNADDINMWLAANDTAPSFEDFLPQSDQGRILFTTRNRKLAMKLAPFNIIPIPDMDKETAFQILRKTLAHKDLLKDDMTAATLLEQLAFLPLAITQASAYIIENNISLFNYLAILQEQEQDAVELLTEDFRDPGRYKDIQNPVMTTWLISFKQIQCQNQLAADYLYFMACINPRNIPQSILPLQTTKKQMLDALGLLNAYSFTNIQDTGISMHRLVHIATRNWLRNNGTIGHWIRRVADRIEGIFPDSHHTNRELWREYLPHALALVQEKEFIMKQNTALVGRIADCLVSDGRYQEAEALHKELMEINQERNGPDHPSTLNSMAKLASTYRNQGRWNEAEKLEVQVMETSKTVRGAEHPSTLTSMANLTSTYLKQGRWNEAEKLITQVIEIRKTVLGAAHPSTLKSMANLASIYRNQGRWNEAEKLEVQVLEMEKTILGAEHPNTLASMANLALTYHSQGRWNEAEKLELQAMKTSKTVLGTEHPSTLASVANLASTYRRQGRYKEAEKLEVQVLESRKTVLGAEHPSTLNSMAKLASTYHKQGQWKEAEKLGMQAIDILKTVLGAEHPNTLTSMANLASIYRNQERWDEAEKLEMQVMETSKTVRGAEHPSTLTSMAKLASTYHKQGRWNEAEKLEVQVLESRKTVLGAEHPSTLTSMAKLAFTYYKQGRLNEAENLEMQVLKTRMTVLGAEHPDTLTSVENLAYAWKNQGRLPDALALIREYCRLRNSTLGPDHPDSRNSSHALGDWQDEHNLLLNYKYPPASTLTQKLEHPQDQELIARHTPATVTIHPFHEEHVTLTHTQRRLAAGLLFQDHPLIMASRAFSPAPGGHDLQEVD
ncbi:hypothetical protein ETB97_005008 [Aspergillus alliaceus]|uniref:NB-ARC domain-containing protein n=1 Tax=Petromyces alliaceus TaxID=209559 RepID=A0A8H5ZY85_PETAA|nr:hypothetical protein ETB97_005008 [Aspergillus burnettii]